MNVYSIKETTEIGDHLIRSRHSVRRFLPTPVPKQLIQEILEVASRAPSGINTQPWRVYVLTGGSQKQFIEAVLNVFKNPPADQDHNEEYDYYPKQWLSPYKERREKVGAGLYGLLGIPKEERERMQEQHGLNFTFFGAPVGLVFTIDRRMGKGSFLDYGMFLQNITIAAKARGLDTCIQAAFNKYNLIVASHLKLPPEEQLVCCMSLGYANTAHIVNTLITEREPVNSFATFMPPSKL